MNLRDICKGDSEAYCFLYDVYEAIEVWDDLHDGDKDVAPEVVDKVFTKLFVGLPANPFYQKHRMFLEPLVVMMILNWRISNQLEKGARKDIANVLRSMYFQLCMGVALITGGQTHAIVQGLVLWQDLEPLEDYAREFPNGLV